MQFLTIFHTNNNFHPNKIISICDSFVLYVLITSKYNLNNKLYNYDPIIYINICRIIKFKYLNKI